MLGILLTKSTFPIIGQCAVLLSYLMRGIYHVFSNIGIENIGLCIIVFTLIVKIVLFPLQVKQQKFTKLSNLMNPEIQAIQAKYKGKKDNDSLMKMNEETQAVYQKYGTSPTGSCLQLAIQLPILFSLYYIISSIPSYVPAVANYYKPVNEAIVADYENINYTYDVYEKYVKEEKKDNEYEEVGNVLESLELTKLDNYDSKNENSEENEKIKESVNDVLSKYSSDNWKNLTFVYENYDNMKEELSGISDEDLEKIIKKSAERKKLKEFLESDDSDITSKAKSVKSGDEVVITQAISDSKSEINRINKFGPINLSQTPGNLWRKTLIVLLIPLLSLITQFISVKLSMANNDNEALNNSQMGNSMKVMNIMMPIMSCVIAFRVPSGLGLYWVCNGLFGIITQLILIAYFKNIEVEDIIKKNVEKMNKKKEKMNIDVNKVTDYAKSNTKTIEKKAKVDDKDIKVDNNKSSNYKKGSMASKANIMKNIDKK